MAFSSTHASESASVNASSLSLSSATTVKAKSAFKEVFGGGGNNKGTTSQPDQILVSGRGGARKVRKSSTSPGPSNAEKINALLASVEGVNPGVRSFTNETESLEQSTTSHSVATNASKATIKVAINQLLGGGGNEHGEWKHQDVFHKYYGRGGVSHPSRRMSTEENDSTRGSVSTGYTVPAPLSPGRTDSDSLSVTRNPHGLFFRGEQPEPVGNNEDGHGVGVGPGKGVFHPFERENSLESFPNAHSKASMSVARSGASKLSMKSAVKAVLGEGGNDDKEWKYAHVFYPGFGRGGEGRRLSINEDDLHTHNFHQTYSVTTNMGSEEGPSKNRSISPQSDPEERYRNLGCFTNEHPSLSSNQEYTRHQRDRSNSEGTQVHSAELLRFRQKLQEDARRRRLAAQRDQSEMDEAQESYPTIRPKTSLRSISAFSSVSNSEHRIPPPPRTSAPVPPITGVDSPSTPVLPRLHIPHGSPQRAMSPLRRGPMSSPPASPTLVAPTYPSAPVSPTMTSPPRWKTSTSVTPVSGISQHSADFGVFRGRQPPSPGSWHHPPQYHRYPQESPAYDRAGSSVTALSTPPQTVSPHNAYFGRTHIPSSPTSSTISPIDVTHLDPALVYALALAQSQSVSIQLAESTAAERSALDAERRKLNEEREKLEREKRNLNERLKGMKREMQRRKETIEGLTWLVEEVASSSVSGSTDPGGDEMLENDTGNPTDVPGGP
ncbi:hypothetical protein FRC02_003924 [Tulasnella sp. 418]|nr:hypothetical protein FRC02_003924 [Tulasnella sp. 418]